MAYIYNNDITTGEHRFYLQIKFSYQVYQTKRYRKVGYTHHVCHII